jgi:hypothetical protein
MTEPITASELVRAVGREFDQRGWSDPEDLALQIVRRVEQTGQFDPGDAAGLAAADFLATNGISRSALRQALAAVFSSRALKAEPSAGDTYIDQSVKIGDNTTFSGSINAGGNQIVIQQNTPPEQILSALGDLVTAGLDDSLASDELELIDRAAEAQKISLADLEAAVRVAVERAAPEPGKLAKLRDAVLTSTASGLAVKAILAVLTVIH